MGKLLASVIEYSKQNEGLELIWHVDEPLQETILYLTNCLKSPDY